MKILYIITKANWGGAQKYVFDLATASQAAGFEVVVAFGTPGELGKRLKETGIQTLEIPLLGRDINLRADIQAFTALRALLAREKPDIVHLNSSKIGILGGLAARLARTKNIIFTAHGWAFNEDRPLWQKGAIALLHYKTVVLSHTTICVSRAVHRDAHWMPFVQSKLKIVRHGIAEPHFKEKERARELLFPTIANGFFVGMLGELHKTKGVFEAVEAFSKIKNSIPDAFLVIMGEGGARVELEKTIATEGLTGRVLLLGHVVDAPTYLKAFDIFLFPSRTEAFGYALLEAGYASLPAIGTNVGAIPEMITNNETGILVPRGDAGKIAEAIEKLEKNPVLRRTLGEALGAHVRTTLSKENMVTKTLALYRSAAAPHSTTTSTSNL